MSPEVDLQIPFDQIQKQIPPEKMLANWDSASMNPVADIPAEIVSALDRPLDFPSISESVFPGDTLVLAVESMLPESAKICGATIAYLQKCGVEASDIKFLLPENGQPFQPRSLKKIVGESVFDQLEVLNHKGSDEEQLSYLAATKGGDPIYLNRNLVDADMVIPICRAKSNSSDWRTWVEFIFPTFTDANTVDRLKQSKVQNQEVLRDEGEDAIRWLGLIFSIQVIPGPGDEVLQVVAGERQVAMVESQKRTQQIWHREIEKSCDLVIANFDVSAREANWENVIDALTMISKVVGSGGNIVLQTEIDYLPKEVQTRARPEAVFSRRLQRKLESIRETQHIYLCSRLTRSDVEQLGFGCIESIDEVHRLIEKSESCVLLPFASRSSIRIATDA